MSRDLYAPAALALQPRDLVALALTGEVGDRRDPRRGDAGLRPPAAATGTTELLDDLELDPALFPPIGRSDGIVGELRPSVAARVGLAAGVPVVLGGADSQACALGAGVVAPGPVSEMAGSSTCLNAAVPEPLDVLAVTHYPHVIPGPYTTETGINTTGAAVAWLAGLLYGGRSGRPTARRLRPARRRGGRRRRRAPMASSRCRSSATASGPTRICAARSSACRCATAGRSSPGPSSRASRSRSPTSSTCSGPAGRR